MSSINSYVDIYPLLDEGNRSKEIENLYTAVNNEDTRYFSQLLKSPYIELPQDFCLRILCGESSRMKYALLQSNAFPHRCKKETVSIDLLNQLKTPLFSQILYTGRLDHIEKTLHFCELMNVDFDQENSLLLAASKDDNPVLFQALLDHRKNSLDQELAMTLFEHASDQATEMMFRSNKLDFGCIDPYYTGLTSSHNPSYYLRFFARNSLFKALDCALQDHRFDPHVSYGNNGNLFQIALKEKTNNQIIQLLIKHKGISSFTEYLNTYNSHKTIPLILLCNLFNIEEFYELKNIALNLSEKEKILFDFVEFLLTEDSSLIEKQQLGFNIEELQFLGEIAINLRKIHFFLSRIPPQKETPVYSIIKNLAPAFIHFAIQQQSINQVYELLNYFSLDLCDLDRQTVHNFKTLQSQLPTPKSARK
ncbi:MAG: hypothetical protein CMO81_06595 [Waddliaceae bacterium]|nr:hypothetical protein [Waddliaceae bacterium]